MFFAPIWGSSVYWEEREHYITRHHMTSHRLTSRKMGTNSDEENETRGTVSFLTSLCSPQVKCCESGQRENLSMIIRFQEDIDTLNSLYATGTVRAPVFDRHQFFGTSEHYGKTHGSLLSGWMNYNYTACCWFPTSSNIVILPSQFWQIRFERLHWLHCWKCRILVLLRYITFYHVISWSYYYML